MKINMRRLVLSSLGFLFALALFAQDNIDEGKNLFRTNCATCHNKNMKDKLIGPALGGVEERWPNTEDLHAWIRNSQKLIVDGNPRAVELWKEYSPTVMQPFENLTDAQIANILAYVNDVFTAAPAAAQTTATGQEGVPVESNSKNYVYYILLIALVFLAFMMSRVILNTRGIVNAEASGEVPVKPSFWSMFTNRTVIGFAIFALIVLGSYTTVKNGVALGRQQNYAPDQPIKFSHVTHAGLNKIDCQYCHDGARRSKHSIIPATNTCMNCHRAIKNGSTYGTAELTKIFVAAGFDPNTDKYIDDYESLTNDEIAAIYKKWIGNQYMETAEVASLDADGTRTVEEQWANIEESLTSDTKPNLQGPIEWVRIHALPDHVFFSHQQHVTVGKLECQQCHGKVEEMPVVRQYSTLSMGWCVNCHRQTEVSSFGDNNYYLDSYKKYHDELEAGKRTGVTVEDIGGTECQKCHY
ncbi:MAG TPA: c-type cytochrome [Saprospiraceae bacterium]|nr:c-type cytochrome [Saprospiraceae bacterium]